MTEPQVRFRDFTPDNTPTPIGFKLGDHTYAAHGRISTHILQRLANAARDLSEGVKVDNVEDLDAVMGKILDVMDQLLIPGDGERFRAHHNDPADPIDIRVVMAILRWLMEQYTGRPTEPSSTSSNGQPTDDGGDNSTDTGSPEAPTP